MADQPRCPKPERLRQLIELLEKHHNASFDDELLEASEALDWLATNLENRNLYHRKQNIKNKLLRKIAEERGLL